MGKCSALMVNRLEYNITAPQVSLFVSFHVLDNGHNHARFPHVMYRGGYQRQTDDNTYVRTRGLCIRF